jgi:hypothetical protein
MEDNLTKKANLTNSTAQHSAAQRSTAQHSAAQHSTGNLTNITTKNILAQMKKSTLIGCDIIVN